MKLLPQILFGLVISSSLIGCGDDKEAAVDPAFKTLLEQFHQDGKEHGRELDITHTPIQFDSVIAFDTGSEILAQCHQDGSITISQTIWNASTELEQKTTLYHELGHCLLNRGHVEGMDPDKHIPLSMMFPYAAIVTSAFPANQEYYLNELFNNK